MNRKIINVNIDNDGNVEMNGQGFVGKECDKYMGELETALGKVEARTNTPDYHKIPELKHVQRN